MEPKAICAGIGLHAHALHVLRMLHPERKENVYIRMYTEA